MWRLSKTKGEVLEIDKIGMEFPDTYNEVHLRDFYVKKYGLNPPCKINQTITPTLYKNLISLIDEINTFKPRNDFPTKRIKTDVEGKSKLIRNPKTGEITLCFRAKKKDGTTEQYANSPNTCYISEADSWRAYDSFRDDGDGHHCICPTDYGYYEWANLMDTEYERLSGIKVKRNPKPQKPVWGPAERKEAENCLTAYADNEVGDLKVLENLAEGGLCKLNDKKTSLYDINGYWICGLEEFLDKDSQAYMVKWVLAWLDLDGLFRAYQILKNLTADWPWL